MPVYPLTYHMISFGMDQKLDSHYPFPKFSNIAKVLPKKEFVRFIEEINEELQKNRANGIDGALLGAGPALLPLIPFVMRKKERAAKNKQIYENAVLKFNELYEEKGIELKYERNKDPRLRIYSYLEDNPENNVRNDTSKSINLPDSSDVHNLQVDSSFNAGLASGAVESGVLVQSVQSNDKNPQVFEKDSINLLDVSGNLFDDM